MNFNHLGLKKLICTCYAGSPISHTEFGDLPLFCEGRPQCEKLPYMIEITEVKDLNKDGAEDMDDIELLLRNDKNTLTLLDGDGDFRSEECIGFLKEADIVVTNPPFSLFREYVAQLIEYNKKFLIIGTGNAITYKEIFPLIKENKIWLGITRQMTGSMWFKIPDYFPERSGQKIENGIRYQTIGNSVWFTNLDHSKRHEEIILYKKYSPEEYLKYDNYDAINVDKVSDIPCDYDGVMGVPITFLGKYNPDQFEIVAFRKGEDGKDLVFTREREFNHTFVSLYDGDSGDDKKRRRKNQWKDYLCKNYDTKKEPIDLFYPLSMPIGGCMNSPKDTLVSGKKKYARILIKRRTNEN